MKLSLKLYAMNIYLVKYQNLKLSVWWYSVWSRSTTSNCMYICAKSVFHCKYSCHSQINNVQCMYNRVATFRFRLNSLCFPCVHDQFPDVFQYIYNKYYFYKWPAPPLTAILSSILFNNNITS